MLLEFDLVDIDAEVDGDLSAFPANQFVSTYELDATSFWLPLYLLLLQISCTPPIMPQKTHNPTYPCLYRFPSRLFLVFLESYTHVTYLFGASMEPGPNHQTSK